MINEIRLNGVAPFSAPSTMKPLKINFCYGSNGSGKTTISKIIAGGSQTGAEILWASAEPLQTLVYNKDFVSDNFGETARIGGIFTLGKDSKETKEFIAEQLQKIANSEREVASFSGSLESMRKQQAQRDHQIDEDCWGYKLKFEPLFREALTGYMRSKTDFRKQCFEAYGNLGANPITDLESLKGQYTIAFAKTQQRYGTYKTIDLSTLARCESSGLLSKKIVGSTDTPIGTFIEFLNNSDWVRQGIEFLNHSDGKCPFCQQSLPITLKQDIKAFFDEAYEHDCQALRAFETQYVAFFDSIVTQLNGILESPYEIIDYAPLTSEVNVLIATLDANKQSIRNKVDSPSKEAEVSSLAQIIERINAILCLFNTKINENNDIVANQHNKKVECQKGVWDIIAAELRSKIEAYNNDLMSASKGMKALEEKIREQGQHQREFKRLITEKEATLTSVKPTAEKINGVLQRFGFEGFRVDENENEKGTYRIVRPDGQSVGRTLSEGEYNFITFLYFYHLVYGSQEKTGLQRNKVVVIDDPISSLDSNVLFIVSTLTKEIIDHCKNDVHGIKQLFLLTHNVYFHKEISFPGSRKKWSPNEVAFWVVKKKDNISSIVGYKGKNPIQTSYELLWAELKDHDGSQRITVFNTLRRILEYYFNVIGGMDYERCIDEFDGEDKLLCKSLISCINDGSHFISDDFVLQYESDTMENYIRVFRLIFDKRGHINHYNMMMGIDPTQMQEEAVS